MLILKLLTALINVRKIHNKRRRASRKRDEEKKSTLKCPTS